MRLFPKLMDWKAKIVLAAELAIMLALWNTKKRWRVTALGRPLCSKSVVTASIHHPSATKDPKFLRQAAEQSLDTVALDTGSDRTSVSGPGSRFGHGYPERCVC